MFKFGKKQDSDSKHIDTQYENMAIPEIHIHRHKQ